VLPGDLPVPLALAVLDPHADARGLVVAGIEQHHLGDVNRPFLLDDAAGLRALLRVLDRPRALVPLDDVEALDVDALLARLRTQNAAGLPAILAAGDENRVVLADLHS